MNYYVFGGANIDIEAFINYKARSNESNISSITKVFGGVARNIARAIGNYKNTYFVSVFNTSSEFKDLMKDLSEHNVDLRYSQVLDTDRQSTYLSINDVDGLVIGASDMTLLDLLDYNKLNEVIKNITDDDIVVVDANSYELAKFVAINSKGHLFFDSVSSKKMEKCLDFIDKFEVVKANNEEYEKLKHLNLNNLLITGGGYVEFNGVKIKHNMLAPINTSGCGDTLYGTFIANYDKGIAEALKLGVIAGATSSQIKRTVPNRDEIDSLDKSLLAIEVL